MMFGLKKTLLGHLFKKDISEPVFQLDLNKHGMLWYLKERLDPNPLKYFRLFLICPKQ
jgi:hypothetical protein